MLTKYSALPKKKKKKVIKTQNCPGHLETSVNVSKDNLTGGPWSSAVSRHRSAL